MSTSCDNRDLVICVHGTFAASEDNCGDAWWQIGPHPFQQLLVSLGFETLPFHWSGDNSEAARNHDAQRLANKLSDIESTGRAYHVVVHSHGGNLLWQALSSSAHRPLHNLQSWISVGTPFFRRIFRSNAALLALSVIAWLATLSQWPFALAAFSSAFEFFATEGLVVSLSLILIWAVLFGLNLLLTGRLLVAIVDSLSIALRMRREHAAINLYGSCWLGIWSAQDEAIGALQAANRTATSFWPRLPTPKHILLALPTWPIRTVANSMIGPLMDLLICDIFRRRTLGDDHSRHSIHQVVTSPMPETVSWPHLPSHTDGKLIDCANDAAAKVVRVFRQSLQNSSLPGFNLFTFISTNKNALTYEELIHTGYFQSNPIQYLIAAHLTAHAKHKPKTSASSIALPNDLENWYRSGPDGEEVYSTETQDHGASLLRNNLATVAFPSLLIGLLWLVLSAVTPITKHYERNHQAAFLRNNSPLDEAMSTFVSVPDYASNPSESIKQEILVRFSSDPGEETPLDTLWLQAMVRAHGLQATLAIVDRFVTADLVTPDTYRQREAIQVLYSYVSSVSEGGEKAEHLSELSAFVQPILIADDDYFPDRLANDFWRQVCGRLADQDSTEDALLVLSRLTNETDLESCQSNILEHLAELQPLVAYNLLIEWNRSRTQIRNDLSLVKIVRALRDRGDGAIALEIVNRNLNRIDSPLFYIEVVASLDAALADELAQNAIESPQSFGITDPYYRDLTIILARARLHQRAMTAASLMSQHTVGRTDSLVKAAAYMADQGAPESAFRLLNDQLSGEPLIAALITLAGNLAKEHGSIALEVAKAVEEVDDRKDVLVSNLYRTFASSGQLSLAIKAADYQAQQRGQYSLDTIWALAESSPLPGDMSHLLPVLMTAENRTSQRSLIEAFALRLLLDRRYDDAIDYVSVARSLGSDQEPYDSEPGATFKEAIHTINVYEYPLRLDLLAHEELSASSQKSLDQLITEVVPHADQAPLLSLIARYALIIRALDRAPEDGAQKVWFDVEALVSRDDSLRQQVLYSLALDAHYYDQVDAKYIIDLLSKDYWSGMQVLESLASTGLSRVIFPIAITKIETDETNWHGWVRILKLCLVELLNQNNEIRVQTMEHVGVILAALERPDHRDDAAHLAILSLLEHQRYQEARQLTETLRLPSERALHILLQNRLQAAVSKNTESSDFLSTFFDKFPIHVNTNVMPVDSNLIAMHDYLVHSGEAKLSYPHWDSVEEAKKAAQTIPNLVERSKLLAMIAREQLSAGWTRSAIVTSSNCFAHDRTLVYADILASLGGNNNL